MRNRGRALRSHLARGTERNHKAALHGVSVEGGTIYSTHQPCHTCVKMFINAGLTRIVYVGAYHDEIAMQYLKLAGVTIDHFDWGERVPAPPSAKKPEDK